MSRDEIIQMLREELAALPTYPEDDTDANVRAYDEDLNVGLEQLRDTVRHIVDEHTPPSKHYNVQPDGCPNCGEAESFTEAVDLTAYNGNQLQFNGTHDPMLSPQLQSVRVWCNVCAHYLPITTEYANRLIAESGARE